MLQQLAGVTGDTSWLTRGILLLHKELDRAPEPDAPGPLFPASDTDRRLMPYLDCGSEGVTLTITRYCP
jgi:hypothetical protein